MKHLNLNELFKGYVVVPREGDDITLGFKKSISYYLTIMENGKVVKFSEPIENINIDIRNQSPGGSQTASGDSDDDDLAGSTN